MRKVSFALATAVALLGATAAQAVPCATAVNCPVTTVPEPSSFTLTAVGLVVLGGLAFVMRKYVRINESN